MGGGGGGEGRWNAAHHVAEGHTRLPSYSPIVAVEGGFVVRDGLRSRRQVVVAIPALATLLLLLLSVSDVLGILLHSHCSCSDRLCGRYLWTEVEGRGGGGGRGF